MHGRFPHRGLTLLELLAVTTILGILALIIVPRVSVSVGTARENSCYHNRNQINLATERYYIEKGTLPTTIGDLDTPEYFPDGIPDCPFSGNAYTLEPTTRHVKGHTFKGKFGFGDH